MAQNKWRPRLSGSGGDAALASWLLEPGSLTLRCQKHCHSFRVRLLRYGKGRALSDEVRASGQSRQPAWVREVALECDGVPVIFAHTTLPAASRGRLGRWLSRLGSNSLGSLLFSHPGFRRGPIEFCRLDASHPLYRRAAAVAAVGDVLWARRSLHRFGTQQVLVTEVFLPAVAGLGA